MFHLSLNVTVILQIYVCLKLIFIALNCSAAIESQKNLRRVRRIIKVAIKELEKQRYSYIGPPSIWRARLDQLEDMQNRLNKVQMKEVS